MSIQFDISNSVFSFSPCTNSWSAGLCLTIVGFCISYCAFGIQYLDYNSLKSFGSTIYGNAPVDNQIPVITNLSEPRATNASDNSDGDIEPTCHRSASIVPDEVPCSAHDAADTIMATDLDTTSVMHPSKRRRTGFSSADLEIYGVTSRNHYNMGLSQYNISDAMTKPLKPNLFLPSRRFI